MAILICSLTGVRGRSIDIYDNKCKITTEVTLGSVLTNNATDGEKTIFYVDVIGLQYKRSGAAIGYLQLETASGLMNNRTSNFFAENTFTFEPGNGTADAEIMELVYEYILQRLEGYKYGPVKDTLAEPPMALLEAAHKRRLPIGAELAQILAEKHALEEEARRREQAEQAKKRAEQERAAQEQREALRLRMQQSGGREKLVSFLRAVQDFHRVSDILDYWNQAGMPEDDIAPEFKALMEEQAMVERSYGSNPVSTARLLKALAALIHTTPEAIRAGAAAQAPADLFDVEQAEFIAPLEALDSAEAIYQSVRSRYANETDADFQALLLHLARCAEREHMYRNRRDTALRIIESFYAQGRSVLTVDRSGNLLVCPACNRSQRSDRDICSRCGALFRPEES